MPLQTAERLALQHQRDLATIAGATTSVVASVAMGADPATISTWYFGVVDGLLARIQAGHAQARLSSTQFLQKHAAMNGVDLTPVPASLNMERARTSLRVTGPVAFQTAMRAGQDEEQAVRSMATQMAGSSQRLVMAGDRDTFEQTLNAGKGVIGWRRRLAGRSCGFCAMLASRGAVYETRKSATQAKDGLAFHDHCNCWAEPMYKHETEPPEVRLLQRQWRNVTAGKRGGGAARAWRQHWEENVTPVERERLGMAAAKAAPSPIPAPPTPTPGVVIRSALDSKKTLGGLEQAWTAEARRITGRDLDVIIPPGTSLQTAKEYAEGVLRGMERFPDSALLKIRFGQMPGDHYAEAGQRMIVFNERWSSIPNRPGLVSGEARAIEDWPQGVGWGTRGDGTTMSTAIHEFGHTIDIDTLGQRIHPQALAIVERQARAAGVTAEELVARDISFYATTDTQELIAEAFADVMLRGQAASPAAREIFDLLEAEYFRAGGRITPSFGTFPAKAAPVALSRMTVADLRALAKERGVTLPPKALKADIVRALEEGPGTTRVPGVTRGIDLLPEPKTSLTAAEQARVRTLVGRDREIFATVRDRPSRISTSGDLSRQDSDWLQGIFERDRAFVERAAQAASIKRDIAASAKKAGQTPTEYRATVAARLKELLTGKPVAVRIRDDAALRDILSNGRFKTQLEGAKRAPGLTAAPDRRRLGEQIMGVPSDVPAEARPIYGYVALNDIEPALSAGRKVPLIAEREGMEDVLSQYGKIQVVLKPELRSRTTVVVGDSLDEIGYVRPSPIDSPTAESLGFRSLDRVSEPGFTRTSYVEAEIHGGIRAEDIAAVVFPETPDAATIAALAERQIPWRVLGERDAPLRLADLAVAAKPTVSPPPIVAAPNLSKLKVADLRALAKERGVTIPPRATKAQIVEALQTPPIPGAASGRDVVDLVPLSRNSGSLTAAERGALDSYKGTLFGDVNRVLRADGSKVQGLLSSQRRVDRLVATLDDLMARSPLQGSADLWRGVEASATRRLFGDRIDGDLTGFTWTERSYMSTSFEPEQGTLFARLDSERPEAMGVVLRVAAPDGTGGVYMLSEGEILLQRGLPMRVVQDRGVVEMAMPRYVLDEPVRRVRLLDVEIVSDANARSRALRDAARERNRLIESGTGTARLLAEVDELISKGASKATILQRLDPKLTAPDQVFAGADAEVVKALRTAVETGDTAKLRTALTRAGTKAKVKPISKAGAKTKFDPATMDAVAGEIADGAQVVVVTRGSTLTLPDGSTMQLTKAKVTAVAKPLLKPLTLREIAILEAKREIPDLRARLKALPAGDPRRPIAQAQLDNALAVIEQKPGPASYNWSSPYWDNPGGSRVLRPPTASELAKHIDDAISPVIPLGTRADLARELERQAELTPRSMLHFRGVEDPANFDLANHANSYAYYSSSFRWVSIKPDWTRTRTALEHSYAGDISCGWHPPTGAPSMLEAVLSHEYGHHVTYRLIEAPLVDQRRMIKLLDETFGLNGHLVREFRRDPDIEKVITDFVSGPYGVGRIDRAVSRYARKNYQEFFAEVWSEYTTMGDKARPKVKAIGDMMLRMAELSDVVLTP